ncbi:MAG: hypothetical protein Q9222_005826, partial [Ikaeria aurantiellina]
MKIINVRQWRNTNGNDIALEYIMVSYTGEQFVTDEDKRHLHFIGQHAARAAGVKAYWVGCSCLGPENEVEQNVWRISDVIRGAFQMIIAVAGPITSTEQGSLPLNLLSQWGNRVWTLPELLLSPEHDDIRIYTINRNLNPSMRLEHCLNTPPTQINRRNFPRFWDDDTVIGQLLDHYEGSVILSPLELMATALKSLQARHTTQYLPGDLSYSLMGLLRQRPNARKSDTAFQAFARLSLANDSNLLLERLICLLPTSPNAPWYSFTDHWDANLWDIYPKTQVCGIGDADTVILDGARAASIRWKSFKNVILRGHDTLKRKIMRIALSLTGVFLLFGILMLAIGGAVGGSSGNSYYSYSGSASPKTSLQAVGGVFLALSLCVLLSSPYLIDRLYLGKVWASQPWFFGIEGYMPLHQIEKYIFGADLGRLSWSTTSSPLSRHDYLNSATLANYCEGQDPRLDPQVDARVKQSLQPNNNNNGMKVFTLVDTYTMTVTLFEARRPPTAVLAVGEEGGMQ